MIVIKPSNGDGVDVSGAVFLYNATYDYSGTTKSSLTVSNSGTLTGEVTASSGTLSYSWLGSGSAADYEIRCQVVSGTVDGSTTNSWITLSSTRSWTQKNVTKAAVLSISIRDTATSTVQASCTITLQ